MIYNQRDGETIIKVGNKKNRWEYLLKKTQKNENFFMLYRVMVQHAFYFAS